jgi:hypothetical protein
LVMIGAVMLSTVQIYQVDAALEKKNQWCNSNSLEVMIGDSAVLCNRARALVYGSLWGETLFPTNRIVICLVGSPQKDTKFQRQPRNWLRLFELGWCPQSLRLDRMIFILAHNKGRLNSRHCRSHGVLSTLFSQVDLCIKSYLGSNRLGLVNRIKLIATLDATIKVAHSALRQISNRFRVPWAFTLISRSKQHHLVAVARWTPKSKACWLLTTGKLVHIRLQGNIGLQTFNTTRMNRCRSTIKPTTSWLRLSAFFLTKIRHPNQTTVFIVTVGTGARGKSIFGKILIWGFQTNGIQSTVLLYILYSLLQGVQKIFDAFL